jgi:diguanylate cyclase (GGDEF)-like protein/PAS domain S-box-containing protein
LPDEQPALPFHLSRDAIIVTDADGSIQYWNPGAQRMFLYQSEEALYRHFAQLLAPEMIAPAQTAMHTALATGHWEGELVTFRKDGTRLVLLCRWQVQYDAHRLPVRILVSGTDIRLWHRIVSNIAVLREQSFESLFAHYPDGVAAFDLAGRLLAFNPALLSLTGYRQEELDRLPLARLVEQADHERLTAAFREAAEGKPHHLEFTCISRNGDCIDASISLLPNILSNNVVGVYAYVKDIGDRKQSERQLAYLANHDALTGLPNRNQLEDRMQHAIEQARPSGTQLAVLFMDLNRFKIINDSLGHDKGDLLLCRIADRLRETLRDVDTVARLGGDEFVVLLENVRHDSEVRHIATGLLAAVAQPIDLNGHLLAVTTSIGASLYPQHGADPFQLLKNADLAMYTAKESGLGQFRFFEPVMNEKALARLTRESCLRHAIQAGELVLQYQPRLDLESNAIVSVESLVRWDHPQKGPIYPGHFIELAEETGMINDLGAWVINEACRQMQFWREQGLRPTKISVNLSALQLRSRELCGIVSRALEESGLDPAYLELEITESSLMENLATSLKTLTEFQQMGITLSIDDFGTGYSSLSYLKRLPINTLKIDKSFVRDLSEDEDDAAIVSATIAMAHRMRLRVVAEGVVAPDQVRFLKQCHCDEIQGYLLCQPLPANEIKTFFKTCELRGLRSMWSH